MNKDKNIRPRNNKGQRHGYCETYWGGKIAYKCFYQNGKKVGYSEFSPYTGTGNVTKKTYHI